MLVVAGGMFAIFFFASLYVQQILGFSPIEAGLGFLPLTAGIVLASGLAQQLVARIDVRWVAMTGMAIGAVGLLLLSRVSPDGSYVTDVLPGILVMSVGLGLTFVPLTLIATTGVGPTDAGLASGLFNASQQIGGALGLAILTTFATERTTSALADAGGAPTPAEQAAAAVDGYQVAFAAGAGLLLLGAIVLPAFTRRRDVAAVTGEEPVLPG
jgi:predicted MFS family arabinose efflux permease